MKKKIGYCKEVLDCVTILEPGISTQKGFSKLKCYHRNTFTYEGLTLYELWMGEVELAERMKAEESISQDEYKAALIEAFKYLEESAK